MAEEQTSVENEEQKGEEQEQSTYVFPSALRSLVDDGHPCMQFTIIQKDGPFATDIFLYQPIGIAVSDGANYTNLDMGLFGGVLGIANSGSGKFTESDAVAAGLLSKEAVSGITGLDISKGGAIGALKKGVAANPYTRVAFEGTNVRTFEFNFKLVPESKEETEIAKKIERTFRKFLYPKRAGSIALAYPPLFQIKFFVKGKESPYMPKIKPAYLTSLQTTFNETSNAVFTGTGAPLEIGLALAFQEERQLVRQDLYPDDGDIDEADVYYQGAGSDS